MKSALITYSVRIVVASAAFCVMLWLASPAASQSASAAPIPHTADGQPDLNGVWKGAGTEPETFYLQKEGNKVQLLQRNNDEPVPDDPDLTKARALRQVDRAERRVESYQKNPSLMPPYKPELLAKVHDLEVHETEMDPGFHCHPAGVPRVGPPKEIVQAPGVMVFMYTGEGGSPYRVIPTDGRPHRTDVEPSYMGDSVGHWEGNTLVVDVNRFNDDTWLGTDGWFHSTKMHVVERFTRTANGLTYQVTVEDPEVFTGPWTKKPVNFKLSTDPADMLYDEAPCVEVDSEHLVNHDHL